MTIQSANVASVEQAILNEILRVMGLTQSKWRASLIRPVFRPAARKMASLLVDFDSNVANYGWCSAAKTLGETFVDGVKIRCEEPIPSQGALLITSNHPGVYDVILLASSIGREDLKIISSTISVVSLLPSVAPHFIFISPDDYMKMTALRRSLRHFREGGALLIFPRGDVEKDPAVYPGAEETLDEWSLSLELFLRKAPLTKSVVAIVSRIISPRWQKNIIVRVWKKPEQRQKIAEVFQVIQSWMFSRRRPEDPEISFSAPFVLPEASDPDSPQGVLLEAFTERARSQISQVSRFPDPV